MLKKIRKVLKYIFLVAAYSVCAYCLYEYIGGVEGIRQIVIYGLIFLFGSWVLGDD